MQIQWDGDLCALSGLCTSIAPDRFRFDDASDLDVVPGEVTADEEPLVRAAVAACPMNAIWLED